MKKIKFFKAIVMICLMSVIFAACGKDDNQVQEIILSFDKTEAYFTGQKPLMPILGSLPVSGEVYEESNITVSSNENAVMRLEVEFDEEDTIPDLMVSVDGAAATQLKFNTVLYTSANAEKQAVINVKIFLAKDADANISANKELKFTLVLSYLSE